MQDILEREPKTEPKLNQREGTVARTIEQQTAKLPSDTFLWAALGSIGLSLVMMVTGEEKKANFIGQWAPTLLILGLYNKTFAVRTTSAAASARSRKLTTTAAPCCANATAMARPMPQGRPRYDSNFACRGEGYIPRLIDTPFTKHT